MSKLTPQIAQLREAIKRKYKEFKRGTMATELMLEKQYKPIITELRKTSPKIEVKTEPKDEFEPTAFSSPKPAPKPHPSFIDEEETFETSDPEIPSNLSTPQGQASASRFIEDNFTNPLTRKYMLKFLKDAGGNKRKIDDIYGPRYEANTLMLGDKYLTLQDDGKIHIDNTTYIGTEGLYELLFKRIPDEDLYNDEDLKAYRDILMKTNAHKKQYNPKGNINRNQSLKYKYVISKLFPKAASGKGLITKRLSAHETLTYWDDPNELCDRLRLLVASAEAGNTAHKNEILNITEELREARLIKGVGNRRFKALLR